jgi:hypothetical protein
VRRDEHHRERYDPCRDEHSRPGHGSDKAPAWADAFGTKLGEAVPRLITTHLVIVVHAAPWDADGRL